MAKSTRTKWVRAGRPRWLADETSRDHLVPGGVKLASAAFPVEDAVTVTVAAAGAALAATSIPLAAGAEGRIPQGTILDFTGAGEFALVTAEVAPGATAIAVEALDAAIEAGDTATYPGTGKKYVADGTILGMTQAEMDSGAQWGPWVSGDVYVRVLRFPVEDVVANNDGVLVRPGSVLKYNLLPEAPLTAAQVDALRTAGYVLQRGVA